MGSRRHSLDLRRQSCLFPKLPLHLPSSLVATCDSPNRLLSATDSEPTNSAMNYPAIKKTAVAETQCDSSPLHEKQEQLVEQWQQQHQQQQQYDAHCIEDLSINVASIKELIEQLRGHIIETEDAPVPEPVVPLKVEQFDVHIQTETSTCLSSHMQTDPEVFI